MDLKYCDVCLQMTNHRDGRCLKHTPDIEGIVEEFENITQKNLSNFDLFPKGIGTSVTFDAQTDWLRTTLKSQADQYERELSEERTGFLDYIKKLEETHQREKESWQKGRENV